MIRPVPFLALSFVLAVAVGWLAGYVPGGDMFAAAGSQVRADLTRVPVATVAALKLRHADVTEPFDIGLFGNSRALAVAADDLNVPDCRFFNFALSGQSLRASVALAERLAAVDRLPRRILVSFDNMALQFYGNPEWPSFIARGKGAVDDLLAIYRRDDVGVTSWLRMGWRHLLTEGNLFRSHFEVSFVTQGLAFAAGSFPPPPAGQAYRGDGSLPYATFAPERAAFQVPASQFLPGYLRDDLGRLARAGGDRVTVYESPLAPPIAGALAAHPTAYVEAQRADFLQTCAELGLECHPAPVALAADQAWPEASHPPVAALGTYLRQLLLARPPACAR